MERFVEGEQAPAEEQTSVEQLVQQREEEWCFGMVSRCSRPSRRVFTMESRHQICKLRFMNTPLWKFPMFSVANVEP